MFRTVSYDEGASWPPTINSKTSPVSAETLLQLNITVLKEVLLMKPFALLGKGHEEKHLE